MYKDGCKGCDLSRGQGEPLGGIAVELDDYWMLNQSREGFLGWMILQPRQHRMELADLTWDEVTTLGRNIQRIDLALTHYWDYHFKDDHIERVYIVYFFESYRDAPKKCEWHLHIHLIPRTKKMVKEGHPSEVAAWLTPYLVCQDWFPSKYKLWDNSRTQQINKNEIAKLMKYLKIHLGKRSKVIE